MEKLNEWLYSCSHKNQKGWGHDGVHINDENIQLNLITQEITSINELCNMQEQDALADMKWLRFLSRVVTDQIMQERTFKYDKCYINPFRKTFPEIMVDGGPRCL